MATTDNRDKAVKVEGDTKELMRLTLTSESLLRLRVAAAKRNISVGELVSELAKHWLPAVPVESEKSRVRAS